MGDMETQYQNTASDMFKDGLAQAAGKYEAAFDFSKETFGAFVASTTAATKGAEAIKDELYSFSKQSFEDSLAAGKAVFAARSPQEFFQLQAGFLKTAFTNYVGQAEKIAALYTETSKTAVQPLKQRAAAFVDAVEANTAA
jgi:phasin family protein